MSGWVSPTMESAEFEKMNAIEPGIPPYMRLHVAEWIIDVATEGYGAAEAEVPKFMSLAFKDAEFARYNNFRSHVRLLSSDGLVSVADWLLYHDVRDARSTVDALEAILEVGRSEWKITRLDGQPRMSRRISEGVELAYEDVVSKTGAAGSLLAEAFNSVYGTNPNPDSAYGRSVKAVETLACPRYLPANTRATLGSVIAHLNQKDVSLPLLEGNVPDRELIVSMMRKLWAGGERHGSESYQHVSVDGAKTALALAFSLVSMLHEDVITVS